VGRSRRRGRITLDESFNGVVAAGARPGRCGAPTRSARTETDREPGPLGAGAEDAPDRAAGGPGSWNLLIKTVRLHGHSATLAVVNGVHQAVGAVAICICAAAAFTGGVTYWRRRDAGSMTTHVLALAQTALVAQVGLGLLLLAGDRRAADQLHYAYGTLALGAALAPWFYAPEQGPRRLLWFAGATALAGALGVRAFMTGA